MGAGRDLRYHAAETGMLLDLRPHDIGQDLAAAVRRTLDHRRGGLVAGGFDAQYQHWRIVIQFAPFSPPLRRPAKQSSGTSGSIPGSANAIVTRCRSS